MIRQFLAPNIQPRVTVRNMSPTELNHDRLMATESKT